MNFKSLGTNDRTQSVIVHYIILYYIISSIVYLYNYVEVLKGIFNSNTLILLIIFIKIFYYCIKIPFDIVFRIIALGLENCTFLISISINS